MFEKANTPYMIENILKVHFRVKIPQCRCSWRYEGRRCDQERLIRSPQFHGNSYLSYAIPKPDPTAKQMLEVLLEFSTTAQLGLVSYIHRWVLVDILVIAHSVSYAAL